MIFFNSKTYRRQSMFRRQVTLRTITKFKQELNVRRHIFLVQISQSIFYLKNTKIIIKKSHNIIITIYLKKEEKLPKRHVYQIWFTLRNWRCPV